MTVPLLLVEQVAHPVGQAVQEVTAPPAEVVPAAQAEQVPLVRKKLSVQVLHVTLVPAVVQVAHPFPQAEHWAIPPGEVVPAAQAVQAPEEKPKFTVQVWQVTVVPEVEQVAQPLVQLVQAVSVPPVEVDPAAHSVQVLELRK